ncbi:lysylphosphatidylglycerol synthase domain-containing protein [Pseudonocardia xishanensis]|uniref:Lysylphosphatidylglycerol synthase domain-containing protein n=1 Tax=Pseudonocardia xishanensis TaxID=630995 RepID=A0ABP8RM28_9PSEU
MVGFVLTLLLAYGVAALVPDVREAVVGVGGVGPLALLGAVALEAVSLVCAAMMSHALLPARSLSRWTILRIDLTGYGASHVLPGGTATAAALRLRLLEEHGVRAADGLYLATVEATAAPLVLAGILALALVGTLHDSLSAVEVSAAVVTVSIAATVVVLAVLARSGERVDRVVTRALRPLRRLDGARVGAQARVIAEHLATLPHRPRLLAALVAWSAGNWLLDAAALWLVVTAAGFRPGIGELLVAYGLTWLLAVIPLTPGGIGVVEGVLIPSLIALGCPAAVAVGGVLAWRVVNFWLPIPVAGLTWLSLRRGAAGRVSPAGPRPDAAAGRTGRSPTRRARRCPRSARPGPQRHLRGGR